MTKTISLSAIAILGQTSSAFAGGDHSGNVMPIVLHMLTEPDHLAMMSMVAVVCYGLYRMARRSA
jgi:hydrogenase/urease accessory protein HupE